MTLNLFISFTRLSYPRILHYLSSSERDSGRQTNNAIETEVPFWSFRNGKVLTAHNMLASYLCIKVRIVLGSHC